MRMRMGMHAKQPLNVSKKSADNSLKASSTVFHWYTLPGWCFSKAGCLRLTEKPLEGQREALAA